GRIGYAGRLQMLLGPLGNAARIAIVSFLGPGLGNGTGQGEGWHRAKRINKGRGRIGHGQHVASFNALPTSDGRAIKTQPVTETLLGQLGNRTTKMLPGAKG